MSMYFCEKRLLNSAAVGDYEMFLSEISKHAGDVIDWYYLRHGDRNDSVLHLAASSGCVEILKYLVEEECCNALLLNKINADYKTPLHVAAQASQLEFVAGLLSLECVKIDVLKRGDWTPLMLACTKDNVKIIRVLLHHGANLSFKNKDGWTAFHIASREGHIDIVNCLLKADSSLWNTQGKNERTPLHTAALHGKLETVKRILSYEDADKDVLDICYTTPLMDAASGNHRHVLEYLIQDKKADVTRKNRMGQSILHLAAQSGSVDCIEYLINNCSIDVNEKSRDDGMTALHYATKENKTECIDFLLKLGADPLIKDNRGRLAEDYKPGKAA